MTEPNVDRHVLVITKDFDPTADDVVTRLTDLRVPVMRFDLADFPIQLAVSGCIGPGARRWSGRIRGSHRSVGVEDIGAVWYRKPSRFRTLAGMSGTEETWAIGEARAGIGGLLGTLRCRWINHPVRNVIGSDKPMQLVVADEVGLSIPETLITNDPELARSFVAAQPGGAIYKSFRGGPRSESGRPIALFTTSVTSADITDAVRHTAHLFQACLPKAYEVRLTAVGNTMFGLRIDVETANGRQDWRSDHRRLTYSTIQIPDTIARGVRRLMHRLDLMFGALDFVVTPTNEWIFLEINPNGQWAWPHPQREAIADALATALEEGVRAE
ncbi:ATP-grasp ribosomal peptide maturase [Actinoalloteichus hymeniacidonis]|uniref:ATP-grasp ribosomal peptide maturase n=1 Tax=Actinoalloteichus hymeniacidonis TaxID=340345 RepID=A0AAC9HU15_9PSEU|nr:ATP-grasp ribosomal peptide maturase [Actinoalloteichus hymeniacidonis]AOS65602.1 ATP-grasp ribosomal peptide maturase [Actinoalloteichus hymeniacidonis]